MIQRQKRETGQKLVLQKSPKVKSIPDQKLDQGQNLICQTNLNKP